MEFPTATSSPARARSGPDSSSSASGERPVVRDGDDVAGLGPGDFFGELSVLDGRPRIAQVVADEPTACLALAGLGVRGGRAEQPAVALALLRGLAGRLRELTEADRH